MKTIFAMSAEKNSEVFFRSVDNVSEIVECMTSVKITDKNMFDVK